jgi:peptidoglycan/LPS O-acetylase OafA/YrhL
MCVRPPKSGRIGPSRAEGRTRSIEGQSVSSSLKRSVIMRLQRVRGIASAAAVGSAILYVSIGFGFVNVGSTIDLLGASLGFALLFLVGSILILDLHGRVFAAGLGLVALALIVGYVATTGTRTPAFEMWGLALQALQAVIVVAMGVLVFAPKPSRDREHPPVDVLTWKASSA